MGDAESGKVYAFEKFVLDLRRGLLLTAEGHELPIRPKSFALLRLLVENAGQVISHDTIMDAIWPRVIVNNEGIAQCVRDIRRVLGGNVAALIRTVPKRGYMFSATVTRVRARAPSQALLADHRPVIALPRFAELETVDENGGFGQGISEEIIVELSGSRHVRVLPLDCRGKGGETDMVNIARAEGAEYMLLGSVRCGADRVRAIARLVDLGSAQCIWAQRFDRACYGLIPAQEELGSMVAAAVEFAAIGAEQRRALRAPVETLGPWALYQRAIWHLGRSTLANNNAAAGFLRQAIRIDPAQAALHSGLALVHFNEGAVFGSRRIGESMELASVEAEVAIRLSPDDTDARATYAVVRVGAGQVEEAWEAALYARRDTEGEPWACGVQGTIQLYAGQPEEGRLMLQKSLRAAPRDPRNALLMTQVAICHYFEGNYTAAAEAARKGLARYPGYPLLYRWLAASLGQLGRPTKAQLALDRARRISPESFKFYVERRPGWFRPDEYDRHLDGLRKAGWQG